MASGEPEDAALPGRVAAAFGGALAAVVRPGGVVVLELPTLEPFAEIGLPGEPETTEVAFLEDRPRLAVLSRGTLYLIDPSGPEKLGELALRGAPRLVAVSGGTLLLGGAVPSLVDTGRLPLRAHPLPLRTPLAAGARLAPGRFLIAAGGAIEEWDAAARAPVRRLRVDRPLDPTHIGGTGQRMWMVLRAAPRTLEIISMANRVSRRAELPEPIGYVVAQPAGDLLVAIGAKTRTAYVIDLVRDRLPAPLDGGATVGAAWIDPTGVLLESAEGQVAIFTMPVLAPQAAAAEAPAAAEANPKRLAHEAMRFDTLPGVLPPPQAAAASPPGPAGAPPDEEPPSPLTDRPGVLSPSVPELPNIGSWRTDLVAWARGARRTLPKRTRIDELALRLELDDARFAIALLYGARLLGTNGVAPVELAAVSAWDWTEALGHGRLAALGLVRRYRERWRLAPEALAFLDEHPPIRGELVPGAGAPPPGSVALLSREPAALRAAAAQLGALLVPNAHGERDPRRFLLEARIRGALPVVPTEELRSKLEASARAAVVVADPARARELGLSVIDGRSP